MRIQLPSTSTFKRFFARPTAAEKFEAKRIYDSVAQRQANDERAARFEMRQALTPLCAALLSAEQDDGTEELDTEPTHELPEEPPPTLRATELYPMNLAHYADAL